MKKETKAFEKKYSLKGFVFQSAVQDIKKYLKFKNYPIRMYIGGHC